MSHVLNRYACVYVWTFCPTKTRNVQTSVNFGRKMSNVRLLFQALYDPHIPNTNYNSQLVNQSGQLLSVVMVMTKTENCPDICSIVNPMTKIV